ncbi:hypothetical protein LAZ67_10001452 [Cordylochernes scorpioides]|uniref:Mos1 transposase HTH domain-containing protein n=1 Tax=Cordylochernes scorpioides TaxID=51811 RepID=A0ABY6KVV1_9ARAC|nr:hypothetical protein LAZ67_10001452 [Cordylochernes scorpioides]
MEQRAVIKFNAKLGRSASETYILMKQVYGTLCLSKSNVFIWHKRFSDGRNTLEDDKHTGRPSSSKTPEKTLDLLKLAFGNENVNKPSTFRWFSRFKNGMESVKDEKRVGRPILHRNPEKEKVITGDETWVYGYYPETKRQSMEWKGKDEPRTKKSRLCKSKNKVLLVTFFDIKGIVHYEYLEEGQTINKESYLNIMRRVR